MSSNSNTSSVDAQNGSVNSRNHADSPSQESSAGSTYPTDYTTHALYPLGSPYDDAAATAIEPAQDTRAITIDYGYQNGYAVSCSVGDSYTNGDHSQSASTYDLFPPSEQQSESVWDGQDYQYQQYTQYYLPATSYPQEPPNYEPELVIDSIEEPDSSRYPNPPETGSASLRAHDSAAATRGQQRARSQRNSQSTNLARSPTARRWSREYSPEERMRVGLPRWETEQHRIDYERQQRQGHCRS